MNLFRIFQNICSAAVYYFFQVIYWELNAIYCSYRFNHYINIAFAFGFESQKVVMICDYYIFRRFEYSRLSIYFKEPRFLSMRRSELFGITDFLANCGGLLGLFLGFSFLSLIEIFYFFTLRLKLFFSYFVINFPIYIFNIFY